MSKTKQETILKFNTIDEAEKAVYEQVKSGKNSGSKFRVTAGSSNTQL